VVREGHPERPASVPKHGQHNAKLCELGRRSGTRSGPGRAALISPKAPLEAGARSLWALLRWRRRRGLVACARGRLHSSVGRASTQSGARALATGGARDGSPRLSRISRASSSSRMSAMNRRRPPQGTRGRRRRRSFSRARPSGCAPTVRAERTAPRARGRLGQAGPAWVHGRSVVMMQGGDPREQAVV
jgi:hypothetical protein